jgi:hypothetical protein
MSLRQFSDILIVPAHRLTRTEMQDSKDKTIIFYDRKATKTVGPNIPLYIINYSFIISSEQEGNSLGSYSAVCARLYTFSQEISIQRNFEGHCLRRFLKPPKKS